MAKIQALGEGTKKDAITKKAAGLFRKKGFASTSMRELAEEIGVEAASLYNHIGSKSELLESICFTVASRFNMHLQEVESSGNRAPEKLEELIRFHIHMMLDSFDEVFVANHEFKQLPEPHLADFLDQRRVYENALTEIVSLGIQNGEIKPIHPYVAVLTILSAVRGLEFWHRQKQNVPVSELENDMVNHLLKGLTT